MDLLILVEQSAESVAPSDVDFCSGALRQSSLGSGLAEGAMRSVFVEMVFELVENDAGVSLVDDQDAVEEFAADGADEAFGDGPRRLATKGGDLVLVYPPARYHGLGARQRPLPPVETAPDLVSAGGADDVTGASARQRTHYLATGAATGGEFGLYRIDMPAHGMGPKTHFHRTMSESFFILTGSVRLCEAPLAATDRRTREGNIYAPWSTTVWRLDIDLGRHE